MVCIGGWGHWPELFHTLEKYRGVKLCGVAPAYEGEDLSAICGHPLMKAVPEFGTVEELLRQPAELCIVSTRPDQIAGAVVKAAHAGLDIIAEKPLGITMEETKAAEAAVRANKVRLMAIFSMRAYPAFQLVRRLYHEGIIGKAVLINVRKSYKYGDEKIRPEWFGKRSVYGGTFPWIGIHALDMIRFTTNLGIRRVVAVQRNQAHPERPDCEDTCCAILELEGGEQATISIDYFRPTDAETHGDDWVRIVGTNGIIEARGNEKGCSLLKNGTVPETISSDSPASLFIPFLDGGEGLTNTADAFELTKASLAVRQSADEMRWIEI